MRKAGYVASEKVRRQPRHQRSLRSTATSRVLRTSKTFRTLERLRSGAVEVASPAPAPNQQAAPLVLQRVASPSSLLAQARQPVPKLALGLLIGGAALLLGGTGMCAAALVGQKDAEAGPYFDDLDALQRRGRWQKRSAGLEAGPWVDCAGHTFEGGVLTPDAIHRDRCASRCLERGLEELDALDPRDDRLARCCLGDLRLEPAAGGRSFESRRHVGIRLAQRGAGARGLA